MAQVCGVMQVARWKFHICVLSFVFAGSAKVIGISGFGQWKRIPATGGISNCPPELQERKITFWPSVQLAQLFPTCSFGVATDMQVHGGTNFLLIGNPGTGKSTILNGMIGR